MFFRRTPLAGFVVAVAVGMVVGACTVGPGPESKGPDACAVYAQAKVKLEDGSITLEQARPISSACWPWRGKRPGREAIGGTSKKP